MSKSWPLFVYLRPFLVKISIQIEKSTDGVLGIRTRGRRRNHGAMAATRTGDFDQPIFIGKQIFGVFRCRVDPELLHQTD